MQNMYDIRDRDGLLELIKFDKDTIPFLLGTGRPIAMLKRFCRFLAEIGALLLLVDSHLKSLGYIIGRHGVPWTMKVSKGKGVNDTGDFVSLQGSPERNGVFKKSSPGDPSFVLCSTGVYPPSKAEIEVLERQCGSIPMKFCHVEHGRVSFFFFNKVELPVLP
ncbi:hypothetical protein EZV62_005263 [Acer yangbiense]|uniref:Uncharacterized protein n=1 Tax=Acer yangbiense TaxID=1000413 RepID=A0A5C7IML1_9ROSI|nr:hypothetical protein EZV62_005263 [Acer yangbiense]